MAKTPDRAMLSRLVDAYDRFSEESPGMGDPEFHEIEDQLFDAIIDSPYRAVSKKGDVYLSDPNGLPGEIIVVEPAEPEDVGDPKALNLDKDSTRTRKTGHGTVPSHRAANPQGVLRGALRPRSAAVLGQGGEPARDGLIASRDV